MLVIQYYFLKMLMVSDNMIHRAFEFMQLYKQNSLEKFFIFTIYKNYTLALKALFNNAFTLKKNLSYMSLHAISVFDKV